MSLIRHAGRWSAAAILLLAAVATASAPAAVCAPTSSSTSTSTSSARVSEDTSASWGAMCFESLCDTDADCWNACSSASSASCNNSVCQYTYPGGGGGGGGGPYCEARLCMSDMDCACGSRGGYCDGNSTCQYY